MRAGAAAQTIGGAAMTLGSIALCDTGIGCVVGATTAAYGVDNAVAGARTAVSGKPAATVGEQALRELTGVSESTAAFIYGLPSMLYGSGLGNKLASGGKYTYKPIIPLSDSKATDFSHKLPDEIDSTKQLPKVGKIAGVEKQTNNVRVSTGFYNPKQIREGFEQEYGKGNVLSTTVVTNPRSSVTNRVLKTGEQVEVISSEGGKAVQIKSKPNKLGESKVIANIPYDSKGLPIFDGVSKFTTKIEKPKGHENMSSQARRTVEMRNATLALRDAINRGEISSNLFTKEQLNKINSGSQKIPGLTWHHNAQSAPNNMQLIPTEIHKAVEHIGEGALSEGK